MLETATVRIVAGVLLALAAAGLALLGRSLRGPARATEVFAKLTSDESRRVSGEVLRASSHEVP